MWTPVLRGRTMKVSVKRSIRKAGRVRAKVVVCGAVVALAASMVFDGAGPASATDGQPVLLGGYNTATRGTEVYNPEPGQSCPNDNTFVALYGCGKDAGVVGEGFTGVFGSGGASGVMGVSTFRGVYGSGKQGVYGTGTDIGVDGETTAGVGVKGSSSGSTGVGVEGEASGTGSAVYGHATTNGAGVFGDTTDGVGVQARSTNGPALNVLGRAAFSNSGTANVPATRALVKVTGVKLTNSSFVLATLQGNVAGTWVRGVSLNIAAGSLTIYLNKAVSQVRVVGFFIVG
jgi:hypothetical protein